MGRVLTAADVVAAVQAAATVVASWVTMALQVVLAEPPAAM